MIYRNPFTGRPFSPRFDIPEIFGDALSYEDQIIWLAKHFRKLKKWIEGLGLDTIRRDIMDEVIKLFDAEQKATDAKLAALDAKIDAAVTGGLIYDPTQGAYVPSKEAMRRLYAALVQSGTSHVYDMAYLTVEELSGKQVHGYSVAALAEVPWSNEIGPTDPEASPDGGTDNAASH